MNNEIKVSGASVDEAVAAGLKKLKLDESQVNIEVIDEGRRAILGIGGRDAVVRLTPKSTQPKITSKPVVKPVVPEKEKTASPPSPVQKEKAAVVNEVDKRETKLEATDEHSEEETQVAEEVVMKLLDLMQVEAAVDLAETEPDDLTGKKLSLVNISGDDLGALIGSRGETLDALQYLSRLMVGHRLRNRASFIIDVEGYRQRREQALSRLSERMANKAVKRGSPVTLEAMPAYERRIIHMTLRDSDQVRTESTGEGNRRRVRIYPI